MYDVIIAGGGHNGLVAAAYLAAPAGACWCWNGSGTSAGWRSRRASSPAWTRGSRATPTW
ncbi:hypothetical protein ACFQY7_18915 [Actinomadura luteofluorescens]|uniref:hypothetical protein n=1 Tax=Actinomadura luteofluorescens TaxID=46163 RepID=UPI00362AE43D